jgi:hypothetical protein
MALLRDHDKDLQNLATRARKDHDLRTIRSALGAVVEASAALSSNVNPVTALEKMLMDLRTLEMGLA